MKSTLVFVHVIQILLSVVEKSLKSAIRRHSWDSKLVRQVYIVQKMSLGDMINHKRKLRVRFFLHHPLMFSKTLLRKFQLFFKSLFKSVLL